MYCTKINYGKFSPELKTKLIEYGKEKLNNSNTIIFWKSNDTDIDYGHLNVYTIDSYFRKEIEKYFDDNNITHPEWKDKMFGVQVVVGGEYGGLPPHIDTPHYRVKDFVYILDTGGDNVITSWWDLKDTSTTDLAYNEPISEEILNQVEEHQTEEDSWYQFDFSKIHSVRNIQRLRVAFVTWDDRSNIKRK